MRNRWRSSVEADRLSCVAIALVAWLAGETRVLAQSCSAAGGTLGPNQFTAESNGTYGDGTGRQPGFPTPEPERHDVPVQRCGTTVGLGYPPDDGCYAVTTQRTLSATPPANPNGGFGTWHRHAGHTTGTATDKYLVVNAALAPGVFYRQTISGLTPGTNYEFGVWVLNINDQDLGALIKPNLGFQYNRIGVDDDGDGTVDESLEAVATGLTTGSNRGQLDRRLGCRTGSSSTAAPQPSVEFVLRNFAPGGGGNDISIDDITLRGCAIPVTNSISGTVFSDLDMDGVPGPGGARHRRRHGAAHQHGSGRQSTRRKPMQMASTCSSTFPSSSPVPTRLSARRSDDGFGPAGCDADASQSCRPHADGRPDVGRRRTRTSGSRPSRISPSSRRTREPSTFRAGRWATRSR